MKNIELKIYLDNFAGMANLIKKTGAKFSSKLSQIDTYYNVKNGRLKFREINKKNFELIFYQRPNKNGSKFSRYQILKMRPNQCSIIKLILSNSLREKVIIRKKRDLWIYKHTRIHLDKVVGLGKFLELETMIGNMNIKDAKKEHKNVIELLKLARFKRYDKSYSDMLLAKNRKNMKE